MSLLSFLGLGKSRPKTVIKTISVQEANAMASDGRVILVDVREPDEWQQTGRPANSTGISLSDSDFIGRFLDIAGGERDQAVAVSCRTGGRSSEAAKRLRSAGFTNLFNVEGGILAWEKANLPTE